jgi:hypothetical protein
VTNNQPFSEYVPGDCQFREIREKNYFYLFIYLPFNFFP